MFDGKLRVLKDILLKPIGNIAANKVTPTTITVSSLIIGIAAAVFASQAWWIAALTAFIINRLLDGLDGLTARINKKQSDFGGYIDILADFTVYALIPIAVWFGNGGGHLFTLLMLLICYYINAASWMLLAAIIEKRNISTQTHTSVVMPAGLIEGTETMLIYIALLLFPNWMNLIFWILTAGIYGNIIQRLYWAYRNLH